MNKPPLARHARNRRGIGPCHRLPQRHADYDTGVGRCMRSSLLALFRPMILYYPPGLNWLIPALRPIEFSDREKLDLLAQVALNQSDEIAELKARVKALEIATCARNDN